MPCFAVLPTQLGIREIFWKTSMPKIGNSFFSKRKKSPNFKTLNQQSWKHCSDSECIATKGWGQQEQNKTLFCPKTLRSLLLLLHSTQLLCTPSATEITKKCYCQSFKQVFFPTLRVQSHFGKFKCWKYCCSSFKMT